MKHTLSKHKLRGGSRLLYVHLPNAATSVVTLNFNSGYRFAPFELYEMAHVAEHIFFESNLKHPEALLLNRAIKANGAYANAHTSFNTNWYDLAVASDELESTLELLSDLICYPDFTQAAIDKEIKVIAEELGRKQEAYQQRAMYVQDVASRPGVMKSWSERIADLPKITSEAMLQFYADFYNHENSSWVVAGPHEPSLVASWLEKTLEPFGHGRPHKLTPLKHLEYRSWLYDEVPVKQAYISLSFEKNGYLDRTESASMTVLNTLLGTHDIADLVVELRQAGLVYAISSFDWQGIDGSGYKFVTSCLPAKGQTIIRTIIRHLESIKAGSLTEADLVRGQRYLAGNILRNYDGSGELVNAYRSEYQAYGDVTSIDERIAAIKAVSLNDLKHIARLYFAKSLVSLSVVGKLSDAQIEAYQGALGHISE